MKTIKLLLFLAAALLISVNSYTQPPEEFENPKVDFYWIGFLAYNDTVPGMNGSFPVNDPGEDGSWQAYVDDITMLPWFNTWFFNGPLNPNNMKKVRMGFWVVPLDPQGPPSFIDWVVNWSTDTWPPGSGYPGPADEAFIERSPINTIEVLPPIPPNPGTWIEIYFEIPDYNPEWLSVDIMGVNIAIYPEPILPPETSTELFYWWNWAMIEYGTPPPGGIVVHECVPKAMKDFGDAPEMDTAYLPPPVIIGKFPTCTQVGPANSFISHGCPNPLFFGGLIDCEADGNAGYCPTFGPNWYNMDECGTIPYSFPNAPLPGIGLVDEGLFLPSPNTIGLLQPGFYGYFICGSGPRQALDTVCHLAQWGQDIDIWIDSRQAIGGVFNILVDWNRDGDWNDVVQCGANPVPEHALVNFPIPAQYWGPASALPVPPPPIMVGPNKGYVWARFTLTERPVDLPWDGSGVFADGETEDYLLYLAPEPGLIPLADWAIYLGIFLIVMFTLIAFWRRR